jgi:hypothetical protein
MSDDSDANPHRPLSDMRPTGRQRSDTGYKVCDFTLTSPIAKDNSYAIVRVFGPPVVARGAGVAVTVVYIVLK